MTKEALAVERKETNCSFFILTDFDIVGSWVNSGLRALFNKDRRGTFFYEKKGKVFRVGLRLHILLL